MSNGSGGNNCKETIFHDGLVTFLRADGDARTYIDTIDEDTYETRLAATKKRVEAGIAAGWSPARIALSTELMFGHDEATVDAMDEEMHISDTGLTRSEQYADAMTARSGMLDLGRVANHDSIISMESMSHLPDGVNPLLMEPVAADLARQPVAA